MKGRCRGEQQAHLSHHTEKSIKTQGWIACWRPFPGSPRLRPESLNTGRSHLPRGRAGDEGLELHGGLTAFEVNRQRLWVHRAAGQERGLGWARVTQAEVRNRQARARAYQEETRLESHQGAHQVGTVPPSE